MSEYILDLGEDPAPPATLELIAKHTAEIIRRQEEEESRRKWTLLFTIGGALFAGVRLGVIAIPHLRRRKQLGDPPVK
jgi:hypothetical protein